MFEITEHTADLGIRITSSTLEILFAEAARGLFSLLVENLDEVTPADEWHYEIAGTDPEYLLFDWLSELLYAFETTHVLLCEFQVRYDADRGVRAVARGEALDPTRHRLDHEVKAVTYHGLDVHRTDGGWEASVIVDV
ncbi:MAG: archease [Planctomycetota bacterium]